MFVNFSKLPEGIDPIDEKMEWFEIMGELELEVVDPATNSVCVLEIPDRFKTDFASVPRPARWLIPKMGRYSWATVVHDYMLQEGFDRGFCRKIFALCMEDLGVKPWRMRTILAAVWFYDTFVIPFKK